ncbi:MAG TPA: hypothetical protein VFU82_04825 [Gammaproteobacteria bacterium]|nr:hypothetical protein [Gammaproteobacteria bacterium]
MKIISSYKTICYVYTQQDHPPEEKQPGNSANDRPGRQKHAQASSIK